MKSHDWERRVITLFVMAVFALLAFRERDPATLAVLLSAPGALLARIIMFYFPRSRTRKLRRVAD